jgi:hypothetical protein
MILLEYTRWRASAGAAEIDEQCHEVYSAKDSPGAFFDQLALHGSPISA